MSAPVVAVVVVAASIVSLVFGLAFCERLHVYIAASTDCDDGDADWGLGLRLRLRLLVGLGPENGGDCDWADGRTDRQRDRALEHALAIFNVDTFEDH